MGYWYGSFTPEDLGSEERMEEVRRSMKEKYATIIRPRPGALEVLERLRQQGAEMCIASATDRWVSQPFTEKYDIDRYFRFYLDCTTAGAHKDKPDIYLQAAARLGASPEECVVVEDSAYCAKTAHNAGFFVVGIYDVNTAPRGDVSQYSDIFIRTMESFPPGCPGRVGHARAGEPRQAFGGMSHKTKKFSPEQ